MDEGRHGSSWNWKNKFDSLSRLETNRVLICMCCVFSSAHIFMVKLFDCVYLLSVIHTFDMACCK